MAEPGHALEGARGAVLRFGNIQLVPKRLLIMLVVATAVAAVAAPATAVPPVVSAPAVQSDVRAASDLASAGTVNTAAYAAGANIPGVPLTPPPVVGFVDSQGLAHPSDHVLRIYLRPGQQVRLQLYGPVGTDFALDVWGPSVRDIFAVTSNPVSWSDQWTYPRTVRYGTPSRGKAGWYYFDVYALWGRGRFVLRYTMPDTPVKTPITRIQGTDRYQTAIRASASSFATAPAVIVATGESYADALAASGLAGSWDCPILLTRHDHIAPGLLAEIHRLGATQVFLMGGTGALSEPIRSALAGAGLSVERVAGRDRYETAALVAERIRAHETSAGRTPSDAAFVVSGLGFADSLAVAPYAFQARVPVLLVNRDTVPTATADEVASLGVQHAYVVGGTAAVSGVSYGSLAVSDKTRVAGRDRYATAVAIADLAVTKGWANRSFVGVATGLQYADALAAGPATGRRGGTLLLTTPLALSPDSRAAMTAARTSITSVRIFGGTGVVFGPVWLDIDSVLK